jgi:hypothetical protein
VVVSPRAGVQKIGGFVEEKKIIWKRKEKKKTKKKKTTRQMAGGDEVLQGTALLALRLVCLAGPAVCASLSVVWAAVLGSPQTPVHQPYAPLFHHVNSSDADLGAAAATAEVVPHGDEEGGGGGDGDDDARAASAGARRRPATCIPSSLLGSSPSLRRAGAGASGERGHTCLRSRAKHAAPAAVLGTLPAQMVCLAGSA